MSKIAALKDNANAKELKANDISKAVVTDNDFYWKYTAEVKKLDDVGKKERWKKDAEWISTNTALFNQDEFKTILSRKDDELAKRLAPQQNRSKITLAGKESILVFDPDTWSYTFEDPTKADTDPNTQTKAYDPLITNANITDWTSKIEDLQKIKKP